MDHLSRKSFLGSLVAAVLAPRPAATAPKPKPDVITQADLQAIVRLDLRLDRAIIDLRERFQAGATVEPGPITADWDGDDTPLRPCCGFNSYGIDLGINEEP